MLFSVRGDATWKARQAWMPPMGHASAVPLHDATNHEDRQRVARGILVRLVAGVEMADGG
ncbi:MAG: hypothetical protein DME00_13695 [Candidatus Rokuibacteriota bacterium]|nr:MAG: hypothetical protein DME00_13695 [Candidatus Rokubacteria bacterium]PYO06471.1 MAG: hypothetical protein DMD75_24310 [Candidatus Rokubacteria bacterium]